MRNGFRRKRFYSSHYSRQRSSHKRGAPFMRESHVGGKDSLHSRFGSSLSSRSRIRSFHQFRHRRSPRKGAKLHRETLSRKTKKKKKRERARKFLKTSRDTVTSSSSSKVLKSPSRLTEKEQADAASKRANENPKTSEENNLAEISGFERGSKAPLPINQTEEPESNTTAGPELCEDSQLSIRSKAIASKITEIEKVYQQVCETFGMVVERLVEKDRSLEKSIQFAMKQSLHEIGEQHVEELKHFIMEYDNSTPDFGDPF
ncbi:periphilin-1-like [Peromyscus maniculatus bairdii]|uniref:periphilin-1-like n=1 Tax=Peromyscus maniculatus bairdii TaxID=230844 RepID=UPI003FD1AAB0